LLNEIGEYEQYILPPEKIAVSENLRLKYYTLIKKELSGLERAMTIIARHFIFDTPVGFNEDELREILKAWCGFKHEAKTSLPEHFDGLLICYISHFQPLPVAKDFNSAYDDVPEEIKSNTDKIKNVLKTLQKLRNKDNLFKNNYFDSLTSKDDNLFRAITYDKIIANALLMGKLRRYYLVCDEEPFMEKKVLKKDGRKFSEEDIVLKMTAEYLLSNRNHKQEFIVTNNADMINWLLSSTKSEDLSKKRESYILAETNEKIFETRKVGKNVIKVKVNPEWVRHFRLIEDGSDDLDAKLGRIFFSDAGSSELLRKNVRY